MITFLNTCIRRVPVSLWGAFFAVTAIAVLASVFISQYVFGMHPCVLCIYQRYPYALVILVSVAISLLALRDKRTWALALLWGLSLIFLASFALSVFHVGVEYKWWTFNSGCTGASLYTPGASFEEMRAALQNAATVRCDDRVIFLFGMTMAFYNALLSAGLTALAAMVAWSYRSNSLSQ